MSADASRGDWTWAVVLAGGEGTRLAALTQAVHGVPTPKQFAKLDGERSMLQTTLERLSQLVQPRNVVVVVCRSHLPWVRAQLTGHAVTTLVQPASRGTAAAILYALSWIGLRDPGAHVLVFPSDQHVADVPRFLDGVRIARAASSELRQLTLLGVVPDAPDPDYGWIVSGPAVRRACCRLDSFVEKPDPDGAQRLYGLGGLWNTFVLSAPGAVLAEHAARHLPDHAAAFASLDRFAFAPGAADVEELYDRLEPADFSRDVLQRARDLLVVPVYGTGWSDWGTPGRVLTSLRGTAAERFLRERLETRRRASGDGRRSQTDGERTCCEPDHHHLEIHHA